MILIYFDVDQEQLKKMSSLQILDGWNTKHVSVYISKSEINGAPDDQFDGTAFLSWVIYMFFNLSL